jgi:hypothetical protein
MEALDDLNLSIYNYSKVPGFWEIPSPKLQLYQ